MCKKFFLAAMLPMCMALSIVFSACQSNVETPAPYEMRVDDVTKSSASVLVRPADTTVQYMVLVMTDATFQFLEMGLLKNHFVFPYEDWQDYVHKQMSRGGNRYLVENHLTGIFKGQQTIRISNMNPNTKYAVVLFPSTPDGQIDDNYVKMGFCTLSTEVAESKETFTFNFTGKAIEIEGSNDDPYFSFSLNAGTDSVLQNDYTQESLCRIAKMVYDVYADEGMEKRIICQGKIIKSMNAYVEGDYSYLAVPFCDAKPNGTCAYTRYHYAK